MRTTVMPNFRIDANVLEALKKMQGKDESMRAVFEGVFMGYLNAKREYWGAILREEIRVIEEERAVLDNQDEADVIAIVEKSIAQAEENKATAEREIARLLDIQRTAFPNMAVNSEPGDYDGSERADEGR